MDTSSPIGHPRPHHTHNPNVSPLGVASESLGLPLGLYLVAIIALTTLAPFDFQWPPRVRMNLGSLLSREMLKDILANILLFMPVGFIFRLGAAPKWSIARVVLRAATLSILIELGQTFLPLRVASGVDIAMNMFGAFLGALLFDFIAAELDAKRVEALALELPLAAVFYLLIPVLWVNALLLPSYPGRIWLNVPLGLAGGLVLGSLSHHRLGPAGVSTPAGVISLTGIWMALASSPGLFTRKGEMAGATLGTVGLTLLLVSFATMLPTLSFGNSRRFEGACLARLLPLYLFYLLLDALFPYQPLTNLWRWRLGFDHLTWKYPTIPLHGVFLLVETAAAFVLFGFILAGLRGRVREARTAMLTNVGIWGLLVITLLELLRGFHPEHHASLAHASLAFGALLVGAYLYRMHLRTIWMILHRLPAGS